jgi:hypothetical protein
MERSRRILYLIVALTLLLSASLFNAGSATTYADDPPTPTPTCAQVTGCGDPDPTGGGGGGHTGG